MSLLSLPGVHRTKKINTTSKVCCVGSSRGLLEPLLNKHTDTRRRLRENHKCPLTAQRTEDGNTAFHSLSASSAGSGRSSPSKDNQETNVHLLSPAKGYALRAGGSLSLYKGTLCGSSLAQGALSLGHIRSHHRQETCSPALAGVHKETCRAGGKGRGLLLQSQKVPLKAFWECGGGCMSQP